MFRTKHRPIVSGNISIKQALLFAAVLGITGLSVLYYFVNTITTVLTAYEVRQNHITLVHNYAGKRDMSPILDDNIISVILFTFRKRCVFLSREILK